MEPQLLIASLYEHSSSRSARQHDILPERGGEGARFDTAGVIIALLAMIGIMIAMAMMTSGNDTGPHPASMSHLMLSTR